VTPWIVVALLAGLVLGWVGRSVRAAGREWDLRCQLADAEAEAWKAWAYADIVEAENVKLLKQSADQWDDGWLYAAKIDARGEVDR
jgi:hypothetical protein